METIPRIFLFTFICILVRSLFIWWASREETEKDTIQWIILGTITTTIAVGFFIVGTGRKIGKIPIRGGAGGDVYWNSILHGIFYLLFSFLWFFRIENSYSVLIIDLLVGVFFYFIPHYMKLNC
jgi:hypothetical protein